MQAAAAAVGVVVTIQVYVRPKGSRQAGKEGFLTATNTLCTMALKVGSSCI